MANPYEAAFAAWQDDTVSIDFLELPITNQHKAAYFAGVKFGKDVAEQQLLEELKHD